MVSSFYSRVSTPEKSANIDGSPSLGTPKDAPTAPPNRGTQPSCLEAIRRAGDAVQGRDSVHHAELQEFPDNSPKGALCFVFFKGTLQKENWSQGHADDILRESGN